MASLSQTSFLGRTSNRNVLAKKASAPIGRQRLSVVARAAAKPKAKPSAMVCVDCGYIYDGSDGAFEDLPGSYKCPVCSAPKKRFKSFEGPVSRGNDPKSMQQRREKLRAQLDDRGEKVEEDAGFLYITGGVTLALLGAFAYFVTNR